MIHQIDSKNEWWLLSASFTAEIGLDFVSTLGKTFSKRFHFKANRRSIDSAIKRVLAQQTHQRWINVETTLIVNVHQRCFNIDIWLKMKVEPTYVYRRCFNVDKTTLKQRWKNYIDSMSMTQCCFKVDIRLKIKVESTYVHRRCFDVKKTALKQLCQCLLHWCLLQHGSITKQNYVFQYITYISFI